MQIQGSWLHGRVGLINWDQHNKNCKANYDFMKIINEQKSEIDQLKAEYQQSMTQSNEKISNLKSEIKTLKSAQKEKITNI